jgi:Flp pilus assembly protein TadB
MSYLQYLCLFAYSGVLHILYCVFVLFVFVLCLVYPMLPVSLVWTTQKKTHKKMSNTDPTKNWG